MGFFCALEEHFRAILSFLQSNPMVPAYQGHAITALVFDLIIRNASPLS